MRNYTIYEDLLPERIEEIEKMNLEELLSEQDDLQETIRNEHLWALGSQTNEQSLMHEENADFLREQLYHVNSRLLKLKVSV